MNRTFEVRACIGYTNNKEYTISEFATRTAIQSFSFTNLSNGITICQVSQFVKALRRDKQNKYCRTEMKFKLISILREKQKEKKFKLQTGR